MRCLWSSEAGLLWIERPELRLGFDLDLDPLDLLPAPGVHKHLMYRVEDLIIYSI